MTENHKISRRHARARTPTLPCNSISVAHSSSCYKQFSLKNCVPCYFQNKLPSSDYEANTMDIGQLQPAFIERKPFTRKIYDLVKAACFYTLGKSCVASLVMYAVFITTSVFMQCVCLRVL